VVQACRAATTGSARGLRRIKTKAKTSEKLGYLGREEGISAQASALLAAA
jgi:2C-methyl-D-erythritol 2,4-cyclodiphosphate synthase